MLTSYENVTVYIFITLKAQFTQNILTNISIVHYVLLRCHLIGHFENVRDAPQIFSHWTMLKVTHQGQYAAVSLAGTSGA